MVERTGRGTPEVPRSGEEGSLGDLPPPDTLRWVYRRKAQVVEAVRAGRLSFENACCATISRPRNSAPGSARWTIWVPGACG